MEPARVRNASHAITQLSAMMRKGRAPSETEWTYFLSLFGADEIFEIGNELIGLAEKIERKRAKEKAA